MQRERMRASELGATAVEYAIMVALVAVVVLTGVSMLGDTLEATFATANGAVAGHGTASQPSVGGGGSPATPPAADQSPPEETVPAGGVTPPRPPGLGGEVPPGLGGQPRGRP